jgi:D-psicose/D-tagatose/L-ribulose 3-epimerase
MKFGVSAFAWTAAFESRHLRLLPVVREFGFEALEIPMFRPELLPVKELRREFAASGLAATVCAILPEGINPISPEQQVRDRSLEHLTACVETAAEIGARLLGGPVFAPIGYLPGHRPSGDELAWAVECFQALGPVLDRCNVTLSLEPVNRSETFFLRTGAEARALCEAVGHSRMGVTIDTFHANIEEKDIAAAVEELGPWLKHLHASESDRGLLGSGHVEFGEILAAAERSGYDGYWMIEGFGYSAEETKAPGWLWADTAVSPERLAVEGLGYLRGLAGA